MTGNRLWSRILWTLVVTVETARDTWKASAR